MKFKSDSALYEDTLKIHKQYPCGKVALHITKPLNNQRDLSLAYSPGVAAACLAIQNNSEAVFDYTAKGNSVAVITNGTSVLGLGNIGSLASKPVMEGKAVLFKRFADIDSYDIQVDTKDSQEFINIVSKIGETWGGINLEDIRAPECFVIEEELKKKLNIPVFHDDQHGTAIITVAALINAVLINKKDLFKVKIVINGAGSAAIACANLLKSMGVSNDAITLCDTRGVIYKNRIEGMNQWKERHSITTNDRTLSDAMRGADVFIGLSVKGALSKEMVKSMAENPIIFAMANPDPEITPQDVREVSNTAIIATGRSDYNNQINNVTGFPYIFRGALDVRSSIINDEMKIAAVHAIANLARKGSTFEIEEAYFGSKFEFGRDYITPVTFDSRLMEEVPAAVAEAAMKTGVAQKTFDIIDYKKSLKTRLDRLKKLYR